MSDKPERLILVPYDLLASWLAALESLAPNGGDVIEPTYVGTGDLVEQSGQWFDRARAILDEADGITLNPPTVAALRQGGKLTLNGDIVAVMFE